MASRALKVGLKVQTNRVLIVTHPINFSFRFEENQTPSLKSCNSYMLLLAMTRIGHLASHLKKQTQARGQVKCHEQGSMTAGGEKETAG
jgi:hypothetical protein